MKASVKKKEEQPWQRGLHQARSHLLLQSVLGRCHFREEKGGEPGSACPPNGWAVVVDSGTIAFNSRKRGTPSEWAYVFAHAALHLGFGHHRARAHASLWNAAACLSVARFLQALKIGVAPEDLLHGELPSTDEERLYEQYLRGGVPREVRALSLAGPGHDDLYFARVPPKDDEWVKAFSSGLTAAVEEVIQRASHQAHTASENSVGQRARRWIVDNYPLLGGLAMQLKIIEDPEILARADINVGAVHPELGEVYLNTRRLGDEEARFVLAHEYLHVGLSHASRRRGRDPYLWNVACDYVINQWLVETGLGRFPQVGGLLDPELKGLSAEAIYDRIATDLRRYRKLSTLRGQGQVDILEGGSARPVQRSDGMSLDEFYRKCLAQGLEYHLSAGRGLLPAGLVEEIRALAVPPVPWDVELGRLFDAWFPPLERRRTFAKPSRRQASTPDIPRPRAALLASDLDARTFGVVLDSSGSMDRHLLARALGAMSSYALAHDVQRIRVVHCDAAPYDQGYVLAESLLDSEVHVRGRGGTILQPAVDLLQTARDFPESAPIMVLTDGACDALTVRREVAYLLPEGSSLPFTPTGPVFRLS